MNFMTPVVNVNSYFVVCSLKDCDTLQLSVDDDEEKELQVCQFIASFIYALSFSLFIQSKNYQR